MLTLDKLKTLPEGVSGPNYDVMAVTPGIVHFGVGNFFRAHQAFYVDQVLGLGGVHDWGIIGVGLTAGARSERKAEQFLAQDCLYSLTETAADGESRIKVVGALRDYKLAPKDPAAVLDVLSDPAIRIVTMTITEGGYNIDENTGKFRVDNKAVRHDLEHPDAPETVFGFVVEALRRRRDAGVKAFTIASCDNLRHNGDVARKAFVGFAQARDPELAAWIEANATFPNGMVDRITPTVTKEITEKLNARSGLDDDLPLVAEDYTSWVLEDKFADGRPALEKTGVKFVEDVTGYEQIKVRMLNASHVLLCFSGILLGYRYVDEALADPDLELLLRTYLDRDVIPTIKAPEGVDLEMYKHEVLSRFSNKAMGDQTIRIAGDGASKVQVFWTETVRRAIEGKKDLSRIAFGIAAYLEMLGGRDEHGAHYETSEPTFADKDWALARDHDLTQGFRLAAFDPWRDLDCTALNEAVVKAREAIKAGGVKQALPR